MESKDIFIELFDKLPLESQQKVLAIIKDVSAMDAKDQVDIFSRIDYRELYQKLFFEVGRHVDGLVSTLQELEEIHLRGLDAGTVVNLPKPVHDDIDD